VAASQSRAVPPSEAVASRVPSGENATPLSPLAWLSRVPWQARPARWPRPRTTRADRLPVCPAEHTHTKAAQWPRMQAQLSSAHSCCPAFHVLNQITRAWPRSSRTREPSSGRNRRPARRTASAGRDQRPWPDDWVHHWMIPDGNLATASRRASTVHRSEAKVMTSEGKAECVVVGVDGSAESATALAWAARYAKAIGATVRAVLAWHYPTAASGAPRPMSQSATRRVPVAPWRARHARSHRSTTARAGRHLVSPEARTCIEAAQ